MTEDFLTYKKFNNKNSANKFAAILDQEKIEYAVENNSLSFDVSFSNNTNFGNEFCVKIKKSDFDKVDEILSKKSEEDIESIPHDYYLLSFSDEELIEVVTKSDEWSVFDVTLSKKLLKEKGKEVTAEQIEAIKNKRIQELSQPEKSQKPYIIAGYIFAVLGGWLSVFIGWHLLTYKKSLPNGDKVYAYSDEDRKQGNRIFILGIVFMIIWTIWFFIK